MVKSPGKIIQRLCVAFSVSLLCTTTVSSQSTQTIGRADRGFQAEQNRPAGWFLGQQQKLINTISAIKPGKKGRVEAFVVVAGIDGDPVFQRESAQTAKVLSKRYGAEGRTALLSVTDKSDSQIPHGSPSNLWTILAAVASKMNKDEDVLVLYTTSHGSQKIGIVYRDGNNGFGMISPRQMAQKLDELGFKRKLIFISACYSGEFIPPLSNPDSIIVTAASPIKPSFGCNPGNDWTFFGDALINNALRQPLPLKSATDSAFGKIAGWEKRFKLSPSEPQYFAGNNSSAWLSILEAKIPKNGGEPIGQPAIAVLEKSGAPKTAAPSR